VFDSRAPARLRSFPLLITAIPCAGLVEEQHSSLVEEQHSSLVEKQHSSLSLSVGVFGIYGEVNLTSSLDLRSFFKRIATSKDANLSCLVLDISSLRGCPAEAEAMVHEIVARTPRNPVP